MSRRFVYFQGAVARPPQRCLRHYLGIATSGNTIPCPPAPGDLYTHLPSGRLFHWDGSAWAHYRWDSCTINNCATPPSSVLPTVLEGDELPCLAHYLSQDFEDNAIPREGLNLGDLFTNEGSRRLYVFTGTRWQQYRWNAPLTQGGITQDSCEDTDPPPHAPGDTPTYSYIGIENTPGGGNPGPLFPGGEGFEGAPKGWGWSGGNSDYPDPDPEKDPPNIPRQTQPRHTPYTAEPPRLGDIQTSGGGLAYYNGTAWEPYPWNLCS